MMIYSKGFLLLILLFSAVGFSDVQENTTFRNLTIVTGAFGSTVNYCNATAQCGAYSCFLDYDSVSSDNFQGYCRPSSNTDCAHNGAWNITGSAASACKNDTHQWACSSGAWSGSVCSGGCSSGACIATTPTPAPSTGTGSTTTNTTSTPTPTPASTPQPLMKITSPIESFNITEGESAVKSTTVKNDGNVTAYNATISLDGIESSWYQASPSKFDSIAGGSSKTFSVNITIPADAVVKDYAVTYWIAAGSANASAAFTLRLLPSEQTIEEEIIPLFGNITGKLAELEKDIIRLEAEGANVGELKTLVSGIRSRLNLTQTNINNENYFEATQSLRDADSMIKDLKAKIESAVIPAKELPLKEIAIVVVVLVIGIAAYLFWPVHTGFKPQQGWVRKEETPQAKMRQKIRDALDELKQKIERKFKSKYKYSYGAKV